MEQRARLVVLWGAAFGLRLLYVLQSEQSPFYDFPLIAVPADDDHIRRAAR